MSRQRNFNFIKMKKDFLSKIKGEILNANEAKMIQGGYSYNPECNAPKCPIGGFAPNGFWLTCNGSYTYFYWNYNTGSACRA